MWPRSKTKVRSDAELEQVTRIRRNDPLGERIGTHTRESIQAFEERHVPWMQRRRRGGDA